MNVYKPLRAASYPPGRERSFSPWHWLYSREVFKDLTEIGARFLVLAGVFSSMPLSSVSLLSLLSCETWKVETGKAEASSRVTRGDVFRLNRDSVSTDVRTWWTWKSFCSDFWTDMSLMCYSWPTSFWLRWLIFIHHINDVSFEMFPSTCDRSVCKGLCVGTKQRGQLHIWSV